MVKQASAPPPGKNYPRAEGLSQAAPWSTSMAQGRPESFRGSRCGEAFVPLWDSATYDARIQAAPDPKLET